MELTVFALTTKKAKLKFDALCINGVKYTDMMGKGVCDKDNEDCMMHRCSNCPGKENILVR